MPCHDSHSKRSIKKVSRCYTPYVANFVLCLLNLEYTKAMNYQIDAPGSAIRTTVKLPASKSISNRALILNALSYSAYDVENLSDCDDTNLMVKALNSNDRGF